MLTLIPVVLFSCSSAVEDVGDEKMISAAEDVGDEKMKKMLSESSFWYVIEDYKELDYLGNYIREEEVRGMLVVVGLEKKFRYVGVVELIESLEEYSRNKDEGDKEERNRIGRMEFERMCSKSGGVIFKERGYLECLFKN